MQPTNKAAQKTIQTKKYLPDTKVEMRTTTAYLSSAYDTTLPSTEQKKRWGEHKSR